jgi:hypothetical protein
MENDLSISNSLFMERFPQLGLFSSSWIPKEPIDELLPELDLNKAEVLYFYGLGTGSIYFEVKEWLKQKKERELIFLEEETGIIASFLTRPESLEILSDPQVHFALLSKGKALDADLERLAARLPERRIEIAALPSYRGRRFQNIRLKLFRKTTLAYALHLDRLHSYQAFENFSKNISQLPRSFYANGLKGAFKEVPAILCGAGPSLQQSIDVLRTLENRALMIAGGSTLAALSSQGISPHFGMAIDPNLEEYRRLKNSFAFEVPLLYSTRVFPAIFQTCNGPFGYMRSGIGGVPELWMEEELGLLDPLLGDFLSPEAISVTAICLAWAQFLGCNPILFNGVDLAYTGKKRYASGVGEDSDVFFSEIEAEKSASDRILKKKDIQGKPILTAVRWVMEAASLSHFAKNHPETQFFNTTEGGIGLPGIDSMPLPEAVSRFLQKEYDLRSRVHEAISHSPMPPNAKEKICEKMAELKESLDRAIGYLEILAGEKKGSDVLAEMELREEISYLYLFYDLDFVFEQTLNRSFRSWIPNESSEEQEKRKAFRLREKWKQWLALAVHYKQLAFLS